MYDRTCNVFAADTRRAVFEKSGLYDYFDGKVFGDTVKEGKPSPEIYLKACKSIGIEPEDAVALEDAPSGAISAHAAGMRVIVVPDLVQPPEEVKQFLWKQAEDLERVIEMIWG